jgi:translocation and assembly module TamA
MFYKFLIAIFLLYGNLFASDVEHPKHNIIFIGCSCIPKADVYSAMGVEVKSKFEFWKSYEPKIKDKLLPSLNESLRGFYDSIGYYDANFTITTTPQLVTVSVKENLPIRVNDINISSDFNISNLIEFKKKDIFKAKEFVKIKSDIINSLLNDGYCSYDLNSKAFVDLDKHIVDLQYTLKKGGICKFGKITVNGLDRVDEDVVVSRVMAREGHTFNIERIQESYKGLYALDSFDNVSIRYDRKFYNVVPVDIIVREVEKKNYFMGGVGYDTNIGAGVKGEYIRKNFFGDAQKLKIKAGYSSIEKLLDFSHFIPAFLNIQNYSIDFFNNIGYSDESYEGFIEKKGYFKSYLSYSNEKTTLQAGFGFENVNISLDDNFDEVKLTQAIEEGDFFLAYPFLKFIYDRRDSKLNPKNGYYLSADIEYGIDYGEEASSYLKYLIEGRLIDTFDDLTLAMVGKIGVLEEFSNSVPESKRFFGGGVYSNRAYGYNRVGVIFSPTRYGIEGASTMANLSLEADYPIIDNLYGAVFTDNTMLTINSYDFSGDILSSAGLGVRYVTPIGPIKLDVGMNVNDTTQYGIQFQIGQSF